ncbi:hypothetical protein SAMN05421805_11820 [Saccharopolyspora antimicrobica]|uniref:Uncharacterized protein n=1 Tax=Saccharopolyspora antimicrobica TaxID=455193 RepID=A0A1I5I9Z1_9PSEU|nr:hypothetical protein ATL45_3926 [Saccharopolyspora antimicrobica]SFO57407.1 hypothetical protein SAMN05421805_11820 [Saccharopolyspora antimicrobica]
MHRRSSQPNAGGAPVIARIRIGPVSPTEADHVEAAIARVMEVVGGRDYPLRDGGSGVHRYISVRLPGAIRAEATRADRRELGR